MLKTPNGSVITTPHKTQLKMDQRPKHETRYCEADQSESGE